MPEADSSPSSNVPALFLTTRAVHDDLLPLLVECLGEGVQLDEANSPEHGLISYKVDLHGCRCSIGVRAYSDSAGIVSIRLHVGRFHRGYRRALRWFSSNREFDSVALSVGQEALEKREIWLSSVRLTTPGDIDGLRAMLRDMLEQCAVVERALRMWFPQAIWGSGLAAVLENAEEDPADAIILTQPEQFLQHVDANPGESFSDGALIHTSKWLLRWERTLTILNRLLLEVGLDSDLRKRLLLERVRPLLELKRHKELSATLEELRPLADDDDQGPLAGVEAQMLYEQGLYEEAIELLRSAELDTIPRVLLIRALSHGQLRNVKEALEYFSAYEDLIGVDIFARNRMREALPEEFVRERSDDNGEFHKD